LRFSYFILTLFLIACTDQKEQAIESSLRNGVEQRGYSLGAYSILWEKKLEKGLALVSVQAQLRDGEGNEMHEVAMVKIYRKEDGKWSADEPK
jgi:hypothetical protein